MSQRIRKNGSPTSSCNALSSTITGGVGGGSSPGASGISAGVSLLSRLLPMKATVPYQLKPQTQPPLQTRTVLSAASGGISPTHNNGNGKFYNSGCDAPGSRSSTSHSRSPTRAGSSCAVNVSAALSPSASPTCTVLHSAVATSSSSSSSSSTLRSSPTLGPYASNSSPAQVRTPQAQSPPPSCSQVTVTSVYGSVIPSLNCTLGAPASSGSHSPSQQLNWCTDITGLTPGLLAPAFSASPSSSSSCCSSLSSFVHKSKPLPPPQRWSPENDRLSPERISPSSPLCKEKPRPPVAGPPCSTSSGGIRRTTSLDALTGPYLSGHWPRDTTHAPCAPCMRDKATQTPSAWVDESEENRRSFHQRSASWGSTDQLKEIAKLRQQLQRSKHISRHHRDKERKSPFNGNHAAINQSQAPIPKSALVPIPVSKSCVSRFRSSVEGLNQEIERIIIRDLAERDEQFTPQDVPDGHRAPPPLCPRSASSRSVDTQTPSGATPGGSRSHSVSPAFLSVPADICSESPSSTEEPLCDSRDRDLATASPVPKYASSPKPNNSYMFKREPPEGCERVKVFTEETQARLPHEIPQFLSPDRNKVNFIPKSGSAFCLVSILHNPDLSLKSGTGGAVPHSLLPVPEPEQRVSRGTCTLPSQPPSSTGLSQHLDNPES